MKTFLLFALTLIAVTTLRGQDIHYSQFYNAPFLLNPGLTGVFGGNTRFTGNYRSQWTSVPVDYRTFSAAVDHKFLGRKARYGYFSGGLSFNHDQAGYSKLSYLNLGLNGSYTRKLNRNIYATVGVQGGWVQRSFDLADLTFDAQFDPATGQADLDRSPGEGFLDNENNNFFDLSAGFNLRWQALSDAVLVDRKTQRSKIDVGLGVFHLTQPNQSFVEGAEAPLPIRLSPYIAATLQVGRSIDLLGIVNTQFQRPYNEIVTGLGARVHLNTTPGKQFAIQGGLITRFHEIADSYSPAVEIHYNNLMVGFSYDINISEFDVATNRRSGPEISVRYIIKRVKPLPTFKICPLI